ncbi:hypothetical protein AQUCO_01300924v1 [Aquilegia coerulea]|uniref:Uncharacterized protein n=1 Tax=Aquilegia coerulea TaxID=218851 RepID=A0A2G5E453_AQUCA|nr:hypothetical protein AQUCO_01300924v1 [Aquilegia coerulea]
MANRILLSSLGGQVLSCRSLTTGYAKTTSMISRLFCSKTAGYDNTNRRIMSSTFYRAYRGEDVSSEFFDNKHIGIDFGATNVCVAVMEGNYAKVIHTSPSLVTYLERGKFLSGTQAKWLSVEHPTNAFFGIKRLLGRKFDDPDIQKEMKVVPYNIVRDPNGDVLVEAYDLLYSPTSIAHSTLQIAKAAAESYIGESVFKAIITFPANWTLGQVQCIHQAGSWAGLELQAGATEPFAAAIAYGFFKKEGRIGVFDLGGKSFKAIILESSIGNTITRSSCTDNFLGGDDFDNAIVEYLVSEIKRTEAIDLTNDILAIHRLRDAAEKAKIELSSTLETEIYLPFITTDASGAKHLNITLTRSKFESLANNLIERIRNTCEKCLKNAGITAKEVDEVLLVGGMARVPKVQEAVTEILGREPSKGVNPDEANVLGAAAAIEVGLF